MEQGHGVTNHFLKVMTHDFDTKLVLPEAFCRHLKNVDKLATITSGKETWEINVCRSNRDTLFFEKGWDDFVQKHDLAVGDIVVFEHMGEMHFNAFVFDFTACEKDLEAVKRKRSGISSRFGVQISNAAVNAGASCQQRDNPYFVIIIKHHNSPRSGKQYLRVPSKFWKLNGLNEKTSVNLRDPSGKKWAVDLKFHKNGSYHRFVMGRGWKQFYKSNKLKIGDVCTFELNPNPTDSTVASMEVHITPAPKFSSTI